MSRLKYILIFMVAFSCTILFVLSVFAGSYTPNLNFYEPSARENNWSTSVNNNWNILDSRLKDVNSQGTSTLNIIKANNISAPTFSASTTQSRSISSDNFRVIPIVPGGAYSAATITGAIKIKMPVSYTGTFVTMRIRIMDVYSYYDLVISGNNSPSAWGYTRALELGGSDSVTAPNIRFGNDGSNVCIWVGETSTVWNYPQVYVSDVTLGSTGYSSSWLADWTISIVGSFDTVDGSALTPLQYLYGTTLNGGTVNFPLLPGSTYLGYHAGLNSVGSGAYNTFIGYEDGMSNSTGTNNTGVGMQTLTANTTGFGNAGLGLQTLFSCTTGQFNTALGIHAGYSLTTGSSNVYLGAGNFEYNTTGGSNVGLGMYSGHDNISGSGNVFLGSEAGFSETGSNKLYISNSRTNNLIKGDFSTGILTFPTYTNVGFAKFDSSGDISSVAITQVDVTGLTPSSSPTFSHVSVSNGATDASFFTAQNPGGSVYFGIDNSTGGGFSTAGNYGTIIERPASTELAISRGASVDIHISSAGIIKMPAYGAGTAIFDAGGNISSSSDERLKDILRPYSAGLAEIMELNPIVYKWNAKSGLEREHEYAGFSAQNVQKSIPIAVMENKDGYLSLQDRPIIAALVNAVKEQQQELRYLKILVFFLTLLSLLIFARFFLKARSTKG